MLGRIFNSRVHLTIAIAWLLVAVYLIFIFAPNEANQGEVYRILYIHVSCAWTAFVAYFLLFLGSIHFLTNRSPASDDLAHAAGEVGFVFISCVLITGPLWAKPVWGIWWTWDARLTLTFILWLLFVSYLMLRSFVEESPRAALLSAVVGIIGFVDVPIDYMAIRWWRTQHPQPVILGGPNSGLPPRMEITLFITWAGILLLFFWFLRQRFELLRMKREASELRRDLALEA